MKIYVNENGNDVLDIIDELWQPFDHSKLLPTPNERNTGPRGGPGSKSEEENGCDQ